MLMSSRATLAYNQSFSQFEFRTKMKQQLILKRKNLLDKAVKTTKV
jgi:hypothetical protein